MGFFTGSFSVLSVSIFGYKSPLTWWGYAPHPSAGVRVQASRKKGRASPSTYTAAIVCIFKSHGWGCHSRGLTTPSDISRSPDGSQTHYPLHTLIYFSSLSNSTTVDPTGRAKETFLPNWNCNQIFLILFLNSLKVSWIYGPTEPFWWFWDRVRTYFVDQASLKFEVILFRCWVTDVWATVPSSAPFLLHAGLAKVKSAAHGPISLSLGYISKSFCRVISLSAIWNILFTCLKNSRINSYTDNWLHCHVILTSDIPLLKSIVSELLKYAVLAFAWRLCSRSVHRIHTFKLREKKNPKTTTTTKQSQALHTVWYSLADIPVYSSSVFCHNRFPMSFQHCMLCFQCSRHSTGVFWVLFEAEACSSIILSFTLST